MQVIGGIQRFTAIKRVNDSGTRTITSRKCVAYGQRLTRAAALVLARQHNEVNQIQRVTGFPEIAASCRRLAFAHFCPDQNEADLSNVPRYNTQAYRAYKQECVAYLVGTQVVSKCNKTYRLTWFEMWVYGNMILSNRVKQWWNRPYKWRYSLLLSITRCKRSSLFLKVAI